MKKIFLFLFFTLNLLQFLSATDSRINIVELDEKIDKHIENLPKGDLKPISYVKELLDYMYVFDQQIRVIFMQNRVVSPSLVELMQKMDDIHTSKMKEILKIHGWITISKFGTDYDHKAWILIQHADHDPFFQAGVLFILSKLLDTGDTDKQSYAYLYDRVAVNFPQLGMRQRYGTQLISKDNHNFELEPYEGSLKDVDDRRREMGLETLDNYLRQHKKMYEL
ncbi:MAG: DUF6624 domain-containing protein [Janthinobacterium lividum]